MRYEYFFNLYDRKKYLKDDYFLFKNVKKNQTNLISIATTKA